MTAAGFVEHDDGVFVMGAAQSALFDGGVLPFDPTVLLDAVLQLVVQALELREEHRELGRVRVAAREAVAERGRVLVHEVVRDARDRGIHIGCVERVEVAVDDLHRGFRHPASVPHRFLIAEYTFWLWENSMTLPSGSLTAQM